MSTYSIPVSGPDPRLAFLRALALKAAHRAGQFMAIVKVVVTRGTQLVRAASSTALAVIGSEAGYQLVRHALRTVITTTAKLVKAGASLLGRGLRFLGRIARKAMAVVSPHAADVVRDTVTTWVLEPITKAATVVAEWIGSVAEAVWELSDCSLVKTITIRAAQAAGLLLAIHSLTRGAVAAWVVQALPWAMEAVLLLTNPVRALTMVAAAFVAALGFAAFRLLDRADSPNPDEPAEGGEPFVDPGTPLLVAEPRRTVQPDYDLERIAAQVNVEVTPDGSVLVHGLPTELPEEIGHQVAKIAADAATARLEKVLLHRPVPNRDDRRLLVKAAREALRAEGRRRARAAA